MRLLRCDGLGSAVPILNCDAVGQNALDAAEVDVHQDVWGEVVFLQRPQEEEVLVSLPDQAAAVGHPADVLPDVDPQEAEAGHPLHRHMAVLKEVNHHVQIYSCGWRGAEEWTHLTTLWYAQV